MGTLKDTEALTVGIDAAVTANHHVVVRRPEPGGVGQIVDEFTVAPTLDGLARLAKRLASRDVRLAVAEPTSMTWPGLSLARPEWTWPWWAAVTSPACAVRCQARTSPT